MTEKIYTFTDEEVARMFKNGQMKILMLSVEEEQKMVSPEQMLGVDLFREWEKQAKRFGDFFALEQRSLAIDKRGGTVLDGLALFIQNPDILNHHFLDLPGSEYNSHQAPGLDRFQGKPS